MSFVALECSSVRSTGTVVHGTWTIVSYCGGDSLSAAMACGRRVTGGVVAAIVAAFVVFQVYFFVWDAIAADGEAALPERENIAGHERPAQVDMAQAYMQKHHPGVEMREKPHRPDNGAGTGAGNVNNGNGSAGGSERGGVASSKQRPVNLVEAAQQKLRAAQQRNELEGPATVEAAPVATKALAKQAPAFHDTRVACGPNRAGRVSTVAVSSQIKACLLYTSPSPRDRG